jgi:hypothetical protein
MIKIKRDVVTGSLDAKYQAVGWTVPRFDATATAAAAATAAAIGAAAAAATISIACSGRRLCIDCSCSNCSVGCSLLGDFLRLIVNLGHRTTVDVSAAAAAIARSLDRRPERGRLNVGARAGGRAPKHMRSR